MIVPPEVIAFAFRESNRSMAVLRAPLRYAPGLSAVEMMFMNADKISFIAQNLVAQVNADVREAEKFRTKRAKKK